jgi:hypothetical protein
LLALAATPLLGFAWGHEGHQIVALIAEKDMTPAALARAKAILGGASFEDVASWADDYRRDHPETGPWHYIDIPRAKSRIDMARECRDGHREKAFGLGSDALTTFPGTSDAKCRLRHYRPGECQNWMSPR